MTETSHPNQENETAFSSRNLTDHRENTGSDIAPTQSEIKKVSLERNIPWESNIKYNPEHFYRAASADEVKNLFEDGSVAGKKAGRGRVYFQKGFANKRYVNPGAGQIRPIIIEASNVGMSEPGSDGYASMELLEKSKVASGETPLRIWQHQGDNQWSVIFDSFPKS